MPAQPGDSLEASSGGNSALINHCVQLQNINQSLFENNDQLRQIVGVFKGQYSSFDNEPLSEKHQRVIKNIENQLGWDIGYLLKER